MALTILDKKKFGSFKLDEKELQKTTDATILKHKETKAKSEEYKPPKRIIIPDLGF